MLINRVLKNNDKKPISHRNYVAFLEKKLLQTSRFLPFGKYTLRKFMKRVLNSTLRKK